MIFVDKARCTQASQPSVGQQLMPLAHAGQPPSLPAPAKCKMASDAASVIGNAVQDDNIDAQTENPAWIPNKEGLSIPCVRRQSF